MVRISYLLVLLATASLLAAPMAASAQGTKLGHELAATCANCHQITGKSVPGIPALAGQSREWLLNKLKDFKAGRAPATLMDQLAKGYTDEQLDVIATYFAAQK